MKYQIEFKPRAIKDLKSLKNKKLINSLFEKINCLSDNLMGDVKKLTNFTSEYRLRVNDYRILFEIEDNKIIIYRILHRKEAYR